METFRSMNFCAYETKKITIIDRLMFIIKLFLTCRWVSSFVGVVICQSSCIPRSNSFLNGISDVRSSTHCKVFPNYVWSINTCMNQMSFVTRRWWKQVLPNATFTMFAWKTFRNHKHWHFLIQLSAYQDFANSDHRSALSVFKLLLTLLIRDTQKVRQLQCFENSSLETEKQACFSNEEQPEICIASKLLGNKN